VTPEPEEIVVVGEQADSLGDSAAQVTDVDPDALPASAELADALARVPGAVVTRLGGAGDFAQISLRGVGARQVEVLVDGIPLNPEGGAAVDLSELPLAAFEQIRVVRGLSPALLGSTALGGAVLLVPGAGDREVRGLTLSAGSWRTASGSAVLAGPVGPVHVWTAVDALGTTGAFRYFDHGGTDFDAADDRVRRRVNNDTRRLATVTRASAEGLTLLHSGLWRDDGVPGPTHALSPTARYGLTRHLAGVRLERPAGAAVLAARAFGVVRDETLRDPNDEIGLGTGSSRSLTRSIGADASARAPVTAAVGVEVGAGGRLDRFSSGGVDAGRAVGRLVGAAPVSLGAVELAPGGVALAVADGDGVRWLGVPRVGARLERGAVAVRANAGGVARPPDLTELYGDRGALIGNPDLRPERGLQVDVGPTWTLPRAHLELVAFGARYRDLVVWATGPQGVSRPENLGRAEVGGLEGSASVRHRALSLSGSGALIRAVNRSDDPTYRGNQLPRVPVASCTASGSVAPGPWRVGADLAFAAGTSADTANVTRWPARAWVGATAAVADRTGRVEVELDVRNVLDAIAGSVLRDPLADDGVRVRKAVVDFVGYPLPGRTVTLSVRARAR
jgi:outer membrane receptor protein involved in Fe transport